MDKKTIWIINQYASTPQTGMGGRHYYLARELARRGHDVCLVAASYTHLLRNPPKINGKFCLEDAEGFQFVWIKTPPYGGANSIRRVLNWFLFSRRIRGLPKVIGGQPDTILFSSPSLIPYLGARRLAKTMNSRLVWDVRDIWPLTLIELGGYSAMNPFVLLSSWVESFACKKSDYIVSSLPYAIDHMEKKGASKKSFSWISNGYSNDELSITQPLPDNVEDALPLNRFIVGYCGTFGTANAIDVIIDVAAMTINDESIAYLLVGGGGMKYQVEKSVREQGLSNITIIDSIPKLQVQTMLSRFDVCYVGFNKSTLYRYGHSLNKTAEYLMSGKPIIFSIDSPFMPVDDAKAGFTVEAEDTAEIVSAIYKLKGMSSDGRRELGENGIRYAQTHYEFSKLAAKLEQIL